MLEEWRNEAGWDRILRVIVGVVLVSLMFVGPQTAWGLLGFIPLATGALGFCPAYRLVGISTCSSDTKPEAG
jgi:hypothetical protein